MTKISKKYIAGFIDGEGCFCLSKNQAYYRKEKRKFIFVPEFTITNTNLEVIKLILQYFKDIPIKVKLRTRIEEPNKPQYQIQAGGRDRVLAIINHFIKYLIVKKEIASKMKEYILSRKSKDYLHSSYTEDEIELANEIRKLNRRGPINR